MIWKKGTKLPVFIEKDSNPPTLEDFARKAAKSRDSISVKIGEVCRLADALENSLQAEYSNLVESREQIYNLVQGGLTLRCLECPTEFNPKMKRFLYIAGRGLKGITPEDANLASLEKGRCPNCGGSTVGATFAPERTKDYHREYLWKSQEKYDEMKKDG